MFSSLAGDPACPSYSEGPAFLDAWRAKKRNGHPVVANGTVFRAPGASNANGMSRTSPVLEDEGEMSRDAHHALVEALQPELLRRLMRAGLGMASTAGALHRSITPADVEEVVSGALEAVCSGTAKWDPDRGELYPFLKTVVLRRLIDRMRSPQAKGRIASVDPVALDAASADVAPNAEERLVSQESDAEVAQRIADVYDACDGDADATAMVEAIMEGDGVYRRRKIAERTGFSGKKLNTTLRRLQRRVMRREGHSTSIGDHDE